MSLCGGAEVAQLAGAGGSGEEPKGHGDSVTGWIWLASEAVAGAILYFQ
jgi:hypothetical protein